MTIDRDQVLAALKRARDPRGMKPHELVAEIGADAKARHRVRKFLSDLTDEGVLEKTEGQRYRLMGWKPTVPAALPPRPGVAATAAPAGSFAGKIRVHPAGYGFVQREDGEDDVFIGARGRAAALDGDRVAITTWPGNKGTEGRVVEVLARGRTKLTGTLRGERNTRFLEPDDPRILGHVALEGDAAGGHDGQAVIAEITQYPTLPDDPVVARVLRVLGDLDDPRTEVAKVIASADIPDEFPEDVRLAGTEAPTVVSDEDLRDRADLRHVGFLTIDPETARDFDDAVCVEDGPSPGLSRLWVAVADVSHYVRPGTALDREARIRGVSVYLPDRAISMLPHELSAGICSLNPEVDRLAMVARLDVTERGDVVDAEMMAAVIRSRARLDYAGVGAALSGDLRGARERYREHLPQLERLRALSHKLRAVRHERGSLDFDLPEPVVILDEDDPKRVREVRKSRSVPEVREAYKVIEDCMLAANEAVARFFRTRELDTLWRIHDVPSEERLTEFASLAEGFGMPFTVEDGRSPKRLRAFLELLKGKPMERALSFLLLRSLKQAVYDVVNLGHFGLAATDYLHFTSPIRRYPDLIVHRLLKNQLRSEGKPAGGVSYVAPPPTEELKSWAVESSQHERRAMEAEREVVDMYRAFLMRDRIGEELDGTITGVMGFGFFVEIADPFIEGLVKTETLGDDSYELDDKTVRLVGKRSGRNFALGDAVRVRIENVSVARRKIDFVLQEHVAVAPRRTVEKSERGRRRAPAGKNPKDERREPRRDGGKKKAAFGKGRKDGRPPRGRGR